MRKCGGSVETCPGAAGLFNIGGSIPLDEVPETQMRTAGYFIEHPARYARTEFRRRMLPPGEDADNKQIEVNRGAGPGAVSTAPRVLGREPQGMPGTLR